MYLHTRKPSAAQESTTGTHTVQLPGQHPAAGYGPCPLAAPTQVPSLWLRADHTGYWAFKNQLCLRVAGTRSCPVYPPPELRESRPALRRSLGLLQQQEEEEEAANEEEETEEVLHQEASVHASTSQAESGSHSILRTARSHSSGVG